MRTLKSFIEAYNIEIEGNILATGEILNPSAVYTVKRYFTSQAQIAFTRMLSAIEVFRGSPNFELVVGGIYRDCIYYLAVVASFAKDEEIDWYVACRRTVEDTYAIAADPAIYLDKVIKDHCAKKSSEVSALIGWMGSRGGR